MIHARLNASTGYLTDISYREFTYPDDVPLNAMPIPPGPWTYDVVNKVAVQVPARKPRLLLDIIVDLNALSTAKKNAVWADITSGTPPKWELDAGSNASAIAVLQWAATAGTLSAADILSAKIRGVAMYCQDQPNYLVHPSFDATINIPGDMLA